MERMEKVTQITPEQFENLQKAKSKKRIFKKLVGVKANKIYAIGDTAISVNHAQPLEIYKLNFHNKEIFYLVVNVLGPDLAFAWSLYQSS